MNTKTELTQILTTLNLTNAEIKIYFSLLNLGKSKVGQIITDSQLSPSKVHNSLNKLIELGIISYIKQNNINYYTLSDKSNIKNLLEIQKSKISQQEKSIDSLFKNLNFEKTLIEKENAEIFTGFNGIKIAFEKLYSTPDNQTSNTESLFFNKIEESNLAIINRFFKYLESYDKFRNINHKGICSKLYEPLFKIKKNPNIQIKYTNSPILSSTNIFSNKILLVSWSKNPIAFLITSRNISTSFRKLFYEIWNSLK